MEEIKTTDDNTPLWIKIFGGSILSITFLCVITLTGYIVSNINNIQTQLNTMNSDMVTKKEFIEREKTIWDNVKLDMDSIVAMKERVTAVEQLAKERQLSVVDIAKSLETLNKEVAGLKEKTNNAQIQISQLHEENKQLQKDLQALREKIITLEGKIK